MYTHTATESNITLLLLYALTHAAQQYTHHHHIQFSFHLYKAVGCVCIDHAPPTPQGGRTPLMLAASAGHLQVAKHLVEKYKCKVNEEDSEVSRWK